MQIIATIKNYGAVPADHFQFRWQGLIDGQELSQTKISDKPSILFPSQTASMWAGISGHTYDEIREGSKTLEIIVFCRYQGSSSEAHESYHDYVYCNRTRYAPDGSKFLDLGACENQLSTSSRP